MDNKILPYCKSSKDAKSPESQVKDEIFNKEVLKGDDDLRKNNYLIFQISLIFAG